MRVLDTLTEAARARMGVILEGRVAGVEEAWQMIKGEVVSLLVERGVGEEHGSVSNRIKTVQIGRVPDRGGRPEGVSRQAALMPEWKAREEAKKAAHGKGQKPREQEATKMIPNCSSNTTRRSSFIIHHSSFIMPSPASRRSYPPSSSHRPTSRIVNVAICTPKIFNSAA